MGDDFLLYIKLIQAKEELYQSQYCKWFNLLFYFIKFIFCILTLREEEKCLIPYKKLKNPWCMKIIAKMLAKQNKKLILEEPLMKNERFVKELRKYSIEIIKGDKLFDYTILNLIKYIGNIQNKEIQTMEISLLINEVSQKNLQLIQYLSERVKRVNVITKNITNFKKVEETLQEQFGILILVTNNKKKSLAKATLIINLEFEEENLKLYNINRNAILISKTSLEMKEKSFYGVWVRDYSIAIPSARMEDSFYKCFEKKALLESIINRTKSYEEVMSQLEEMQVEITALWGKNGKIQSEEIKNI